MKNSKVAARKTGSPRRTSHQGKVTLERALSKLGIASRTRAAALISEGRVTLQNRVVTNPLQWVTPEALEIRIDGVLQGQKQKVYYLLHKPKGVITTHDDEKNRPTVFSLIPNLKEHLITVGRLDFATSGLLILTNDTAFSAKLTDPTYRIPRTYLVTVKGLLEDQHLQQMLDGIHEGGEILQATRAMIRKSSERETHLTLTLCQGKNREIRRMCDFLKRPVTSLKRIQFGSLTLDEKLAPGECRLLTENEINDLQKLIQD